MLGRIRDNLASITIVVVIVGYYDTYRYYQAFGIDISVYLDPSEIVFAFSSILAFVLGTLALPFMNLLAFTDIYDPIKKIPDVVDEDSRANAEKVLWSHLKKSFFRLLFFLILMIVHLVFYFLEDSQDVTEGRLLVNFILGIILMLLFSICLRIGREFIAVDLKSNRWMNRKPSKLEIFKVHESFYLVLFVFFLLVIDIRVETRSQNVLDGYPKYAVTIETANRTIVSDSIVTYVGSTRSHVILYDRVKNKAAVYPQSTVTSLEVRELRKGL